AGVEGQDLAGVGGDGRAGAAELHRVDCGVVDRGVAADEDVLVRRVHRTGERSIFAGCTAEGASETAVDGDEVSAAASRVGITDDVGEDADGVGSSAAAAADQRAG